MIRVGTTSRYLIGPYFLDGPDEHGFLCGNFGDVAQTSALRDGTHGRRVAAQRWSTPTLRFFHSRQSEGTFRKPVACPWFTDSYGTTNMASPDRTTPDSSWWVASRG